MTGARRYERLVALDRHLAHLIAQANNNVTYEALVIAIMLGFLALILILAVQTLGLRR